MEGLLNGRAAHRIEGVATIYCYYSLTEAPTTTDAVDNGFGATLTESLLKNAKMTVEVG